MTTTEKKRRIEEIGAVYHALLVEQVTLQLEVEVEDGRPDSYKARWARAWLAHDMPECDRLMKLEYPEEEARRA
jgi:hypothetical protein